MCGKGGPLENSLETVEGAGKLKTLKTDKREKRKS